MKHNPLTWFIKRIGKVIYRTEVSCKCPTCEKVEALGRVILNKEDAKYLHMVSIDLDIEYFDK